MCQQIGSSHVGTGTPLHMPIFCCVCVCVCVCFFLQPMAAMYKHKHGYVSKYHGCLGTETNWSGVAKSKAFSGWQMLPLGCVLFTDCR